MSEQPQQRQVTAAQAAALAEVERQRQEQVALGASAMAAALTVWPGFTAAFAAGSFGRWFDDLVAIVRAYGGLSWQQGRQDYLDLRRLAGVGGLEPAQRPIDVNTYRLWLDVRDQVIRPYAKALAAGAPPEKAVETARVRTATLAQKHALEPARALVHQAVDQAAAERGAPLPPQVQAPRPGEVDRQLVGWVRTTDGDPCYFCAMLASRGAVYASFESAQYRADGEDYHPGCGCKAYPVWDSDPALPEINLEMAGLYREAQRNPPPGERLDLQKPREDDGDPDVAGRQARNNFRRALARRSRDMQAAVDDRP